MRAATLAAAILFALPALAQVPTPKLEAKSVKITLDWAYQGPESMFLYGAEKGVFTNRGLDVQLDRGNGTGDTLVRVASGAYDFGWADIGSMIKFNALNPGKGLVAVYVSGDKSPLAVVTVAGRGIAAPKDLQGRVIGAEAGSAAQTMFSVFAAHSGFDPATVKWKQLGGALRETMMVRGDVDAVSGFTQSTIMSVVALGVPLENVVALRYADFGLQQYGESWVARAAFVHENPNTTKAVVAALNESTKLAIADPAASVKAILPRDPLANLQVECLRLLDALKTQTMTEVFRTQGLSTVDPKRLHAGIQETLTAFDIKQDMPNEAVFTPAYLPSAADRIPPPLGTCP